MCGNQIDVAIGKVVYTQMLNERGGIEADVTITRLAPGGFYIVDAAATQTKTFSYIQAHITQDEYAFLIDVTSAYAVLSVMGPHSRALLSTLTDADLSNQAFPFSSSQEIDFADATLRAIRITYVGELGWELHIPTEFALSIYDALTQAGKAVFPPALRLSCAQFLTHRKRLSSLGARRGRRRHTSRSGPGFCRPAE